MFTDSVPRKMRQIFALFALLILCACASDKKPGDQTPQELYDTAQSKFKSKEYAEAAKAYEVLEKEYPYSKFSKEGLLQTAIAYYNQGDYEKAVAPLTRYREIYPGADNSDYALYLLAMCRYNRIADPRRDQDETLKAKRLLTELINRYPESEYADDAKFKLNFANNQLASKEMEVGRYYLERGQVIAAINRFKTVVKQYDTSEPVKEALYRMVEGYLILGATDEAKNAAALLGKNYPGDVWYERAYALLNEN